MEGQELTSLTSLQANLMVERRWVCRGDGGDTGLEA